MSEERMNNTKRPFTYRCITWREVWGLLILRQQQCHGTGSLHWIYAEMFGVKWGCIPFSAPCYLKCEAYYLNEKVRRQWITITMTRKGQISILLLLSIWEGVRCRYFRYEIFLMYHDIMKQSFSEYQKNEKANIVTSYPLQKHGYKKGRTKSCRSILNLESHLFTLWGEYSKMMEYLFITLGFLSRIQNGAVPKKANICLWLLSQKPLIIATWSTITFHDIFPG